MRNLGYTNQPASLIGLQYSKCLPGRIALKSNLDLHPWTRLQSVLSSPWSQRSANDATLRLCLAPDHHQ